MPGIQPTLRLGSSEQGSFCSRSIPHFSNILYGARLLILLSSVQQSKISRNCPGPLERRKDEMTRKGGLQRRQQRQTLFAQGGQIAANESKGLSASNATEAAGDLLLNFDHAKISLCEIIVKIHTKVLQEVQDGFLMFTQAIEQIASVTLFASTPFPRWSSCPWESLIPFIEQTEKLRFPINDFQRVKPV